MLLGLADGELAGAGGCVLLFVCEKRAGRKKGEMEARWGRVGGVGYLEEPERQEDSALPNCYARALVHIPNPLRVCRGGPRLVPGGWM